MHQWACEEDIVNVGEDRQGGQRELTGGAQLLKECLDGKTEESCGAAFTLEEAIIDQDSDPEAKTFVYPYHRWSMLPHARQEGCHARAGEENLLKDKESGDGAKCIGDVSGNKDIVRQRVSQALCCSEQAVSTSWEAQPELLRGELVHKTRLVEVKCGPSGKFETALKEQDGPHATLGLVERSTPAFGEDT